MSAGAGGLDRAGTRASPVRGRRGPRKPSALLTRRRPAESAEPARPAFRKFKQCAFYKARPGRVTRGLRVQRRHPRQVPDKARPVSARERANTSASDGARTRRRPAPGGRRERLSGFVRSPAAECPAQEATDGGVAVSGSQPELSLHNTTRPCLTAERRSLAYHTRAQPVSITTLRRSHPPRPGASSQAKPKISQQAAMETLTTESRRLCAAGRMRAGGAPLGATGPDRAWTRRDACAREELRSGRPARTGPGLGAAHARGRGCARVDGPGLGPDSARRMRAGGAALGATGLDWVWAAGGAGGRRRGACCAEVLWSGLGLRVWTRALSPRGRLRFPVPPAGRAARRRVSGARAGVFSRSVKMLALVFACEGGFCWRLQ